MSVLPNTSRSCAIRLRAKLNIGPLVGLAFHVHKASGNSRPTNDCKTRLIDVAGQRAAVDHNGDKQIAQLRVTLHHQHFVQALLSLVVVFIQFVRDADHLERFVLDAVTRSQVRI